MSEKLKPCPLCGGEGKGEQWTDAWINCTNQECWFACADGRVPRDAWQSLPRPSEAVREIVGEMEAMTENQFSGQSPPSVISMQHSVSEWVDRLRGQVTSYNADGSELGNRLDATAGQDAGTCDTCDCCGKEHAVDWFTICGSCYVAPPCGKCTELRAELLERAEYVDDLLMRMSQIHVEAKNIAFENRGSEATRRLSALLVGFAKWVDRTTNGK